MKISEQTYNRLKEIVLELNQIKEENKFNAIEMKIEDEAQRLYIRGDHRYDFHAAKFNHIQLPDTTYEEFLEER